mmetsp:Transcript_36296/g.91435  ORF Transcript_36296/g.91435 Transcript_36296/m.91435 type:complete len:583 (+) Transcript_36296:132-1880(+)
MRSKVCERAHDVTSASTMARAGGFVVRQEAPPRHRADTHDSAGRPPLRRWVGRISFAVFVLLLQLLVVCADRPRERSGGATKTKHSAANRLTAADEADGNSAVTSVATAALVSVARLATGYSDEQQHEPMSLLEEAAVAQMQRSQMIGMGKDLMKMAAFCVIFTLAYKMISGFCATKRADCRRCKPIARFLMYIGYDDFETFDTVVSVHSVGEVKKEGMFGEKEFKIVISFNYSKFETSGTKDCRWEQTKAIEVPQGASECEVTLWSLGTMKDSKIASCTFETKKHMIDSEDFYGIKKKYKLEMKGKLVGTAYVTFRKKGEGGLSDLPIKGIDEESGLAIEVLKEWEELCATPGYVPPEGKLEGDQAIFVLSKVLTDELREINEKGKEEGKVYIRVIKCNFADLQGDDRDEEVRKQMEKAKKKGLTQLEQKWYWCWYENKKAAEKKWTHPDGFFPMASISQVARAPERNDEFMVKYTGTDGKSLQRYRREAGKGLDVWVDGLELAFQAARHIIKEQKDGQAKEEAALARMQAMHQQWLQTRGMPTDQASWKQWFEYFKSNNYEEELITKFYQQLQKQQRKAR